MSQPETPKPDRAAQDSGHQIPTDQTAPDQTAPDQMEPDQAAPARTSPDGTTSEPPIEASAPTLEVEMAGADVPAASEPPAAADLAPQDVPAPSAVVGEDGQPLPGAEWGYVDSDGNVRQRDGAKFKGRVIGRAKGRPVRTVFAFFVDRFEQLRRLGDHLQAEVDNADNKGRFSERIQRLLERVRMADALGDFDRLITRLEAMRESVLAYQAEQREAKLALCDKAEKLADSTEWRKTTDALKALQAEWKKLGSATRADDEALWKRFRGACDTFFTNRDSQRQNQQEQTQAARKAKEALCVEAEQLADSTEWSKTVEKQEELMKAWKQAGWAGRPLDEQLWKRFRDARAKFYDNRKKARNERRGQLTENKTKKDDLCEAVEALLTTEDHYAAMEQVKQIQAEWKQIGPSPRAVSDQQWARFKKACDDVFNRSRKQVRRGRSDRQRGRQQRDDRKRQQAEALRESIARDKENLTRWERAMKGNQAGGVFGASVKQRIDTVAAELAEKESQLEALQAQIAAEQAQASAKPPAAKPAQDATGAESKPASEQASP